MAKPPTATRSQAPWPGSRAMPQWSLGELIDAPRFRLKNLWMMIGPGLVMGAAAIGGGEWLAGPAVIKSNLSGGRQTGLAQHGKNFLFRRAIKNRRRDMHPIAVFFGQFQNFRFLGSVNEFIGFTGI